MQTIPLETIDQNLSSQIKKVLIGEEVIFSEQGKPLVKILPIINKTENEDWNSFVVKEFFAGYGKSDSIYDSL